MIGLPAGTQVWLAAGHTNRRKGFDGLSAVAKYQLLQAQSLPDDPVLLKQMLLSMQADLASEKAQNQQLT